VTRWRDTHDIVQKRFGKANISDWGIMLIICLFTIILSFQRFLRPSNLPSLPIKAHLVIEDNSLGDRHDIQDLLIHELRICLPLPIPAHSPTSTRVASMTSNLSRADVHLLRLPARMILHLHLCPESLIDCIRTAFHRAISLNLHGLVILPVADPFL